MPVDIHRKSATPTSNCRRKKGDPSVGIVTGQDIYIANHSNVSVLLSIPYDSSPVTVSSTLLYIGVDRRTAFNHLWTVRS